MNIFFTVNRFFSVNSSLTVLLGLIFLLQLHQRHFRNRQQQGGLDLPDRSHDGAGDSSGYRRTGKSSGKSSGEVPDGAYALLQAERIVGQPLASLPPGTGNLTDVK